MEKRHPRRPHVQVLLHGVPQQRELELLPDGSQPLKDLFFQEGDTIPFGEREAKVFHTPGHTPGGICLLVGRHLISGDTLFPGGPGNTWDDADNFATIIEQIRSVNGGSRFVFRSMHARGRPMSENTLNAALRRLGYDKDTMTAHGLRSLASSILNEQHWHKDAIERQLAHGERDKIRAAYNHADYLPERRKMMQAWVDYLGSLRAIEDSATPMPLDATHSRWVKL